MKFQNKGGGSTSAWRLERSTKRLLSVAICVACYVLTLRSFSDEMKNAQARNRIPEGEQFSGLFVMGNFTSVCPPSVNQSCIQHHKIQRTEIQKNDSSRKKQSQAGDNVDRFQPISEKRFSVQSAMSDGKKQTQHRLKNWDNKPTFFSNATMTSSFRLRFDWTKLEPLSMLAILPLRQYFRHRLNILRNPHSGHFMLNLITPTNMNCNQIFRHCSSFVENQS